MCFFWSGDWRILAKRASRRALVSVVDESLLNRRMEAKTEREVDFFDQKREETKHRTEWCAEANRYRCMRCGRGSKYMKMSWTCKGPKFFSKKHGKWRSCHVGGHDLVRRMDGQGEVLIWFRKCSGYARQSMEPKLMNCCRPDAGTQEFCNMIKRIQVLEEGRVPAKEAKNWRIGGEKKRITRKGEKKLLNNFEMGKLHGTKRPVELGQKEKSWRKEESYTMKWHPRVRQNVEEDPSPGRQ